MEELTILDISIRLLVAAVLSAVIGYEREHRHKPAGLRTNILVGMGTALIMIVSVEIARLSSSDGSVDISRIASSVLPGIGFLGAGSIIQSRGSVRGLTTAASIWVVSAIGMAAGMGMYELAIVGTVLAFVTLAILPVTHAEEENGSHQ